VVGTLFVDNSESDPMIYEFGKQLREGRGLLGAWCTFASFASVEVMTQLGLDFLVLDMQHCEITQAQFPSLLGAFREGGPVPVVRAPKNDYHIINWLFDQGVGAVLVPMINSVAEARRAVEAAKFPPLGKRSFGPYRAATYSFRGQEYMANADSAATLILQIESEDAARNVDEILALPGVDAIFLGPNDLAFSMLKPGESFSKPADDVGAADALKQWTTFARNPEVLSLCEHVRHRAKMANIPFGLTSGSMEEARQWLDKGAAMMTLGSDFLFIRAGFRQICTMPDKRAGAAD
jgi:4-hydroxy-2-oxoheptanedioate aldolase